MAFAIKLQYTVGDITAFDCTGGEPQDQHGTIAEIDPATDEQVAIAAKVHDLMAQLPNMKVPMFGGSARLQLRKMDSDGRV